MRVLYETVDNLRSEKNVIGYVSGRWNVASFKLPMSYKLDYAMYRNEKLVGFAEVKCRTHRLS